MSNVMIAIILGLWSGVSMVLNLSGVGVRTCLITGLIAGACCGDVNMGLQLGATLTIASMGFYTYGGATIPDYITGTIFGTVVGAKTGDLESGVVIASGIALLMSEMDILGRASTTVFQHLGEGALAKNDIKKFEIWTLCGVIPWTLSRMIPTVVGLLLIDNMVAITNFALSIEWIANGLKVVGKVLPAVGFALLLSYMDLGKYWPFFVIGFVLYAYCGMGTLALALVGAAAASFYVQGGTK
ncbi:MAG: PTS sugar transporter subunit IIC [Erysipelotrichaceae bacterium]|nr:PTS sugar transporter subunit IIC [Erysipelotrichaceae bacterium]